MAYATAGLRMIRSGIINEWLLQTTDTPATALGSGYITDAGVNGVLPGKGMQIGDIVHIQQVGAIPASQSAPAAVTAMQTAFVDAISAAGAADMTAFT